MWMVRMEEAPLRPFLLHVQAQEMVLIPMVCLGLLPLPVVLRVAKTIIGRVTLPRQSGLN